MVCLSIYKDILNNHHNNTPFCCGVHLCMAQDDDITMDDFMDTIYMLIANGHDEYKDIEVYTDLEED